MYVGTAGPSTLRKTGLLPASTAATAADHGASSVGRSSAEPPDGAAGALPPPFPFGGAPAGADTGVAAEAEDENEKRRGFIVQELVSTEDVYCQKLAILKDHFLRPLVGSGSKVRHGLAAPAALLC